MDVQKVASLAKLHIPANQHEAFARDMEGIMKMVDSLPDLPDDGRMPAGDFAMGLREDVVTPSLPRAAVLQNAPATDEEYIAVPKVLD